MKLRRTTPQLPLYPSHCLCVFSVIYAIHILILHPHTPSSYPILVPHSHTPSSYLILLPHPRTPFSFSILIPHPRTQSILIPHSHTPSSYPILIPHSRTPSSYPILVPQCGSSRSGRTRNSLGGRSQLPWDGRWLLREGKEKKDKILLGTRGPLHDSVNVSVHPHMACQNVL